MSSKTRRSVLKGGAAIAGAFTLGFPSIARSQTDKIKIGHLTPLTGFLGALGAYAQLGLRMAEEEINKSGGVMGRQLDIISEDSVNPATAATKAQRMLEQDGATVLMGEISSASAVTIMQVAARNKRLFMQVGARSDVLRGKNCNRYMLPRRHPQHGDGQRSGQGAAARQPGEGQEVHHSDRRLRVRPRSAARRQGLLRRQRGHADRRRADRHRRDRLQPLPAEDPPGKARRGVLQPRRQPGHQPDQAVRRVRPPLPDRRLQPEYGRCLGCGRGQSERHVADCLAPRSRHARLQGVRRRTLPPRTASRRRTTPGSSTSRSR